ncbi:MAG: DUF2225 domain-containing protein [Ruminococcaceae bacterium]|nr:DUF2225 domain-containing protein [Oscillospiraceae bacterium]
MSRPKPITVTCALCGEESTQIILLSTNRMGSSDLDLRPPEMARSTMCWWLQECPHCGYVAWDLKNTTSLTRDLLREVIFSPCEERNFDSKLAARYYKLYLTLYFDSKREDAFRAALRAAWACDDVGDSENAVFCRKLALSLADRVIASKHNDENLIIQKADLLRRSGQFDTLIREYADKTFSKPILNQIVAFQIQKAKEKDTGCYTVADVIDGEQE